LTSGFDQTAGKPPSPDAGPTASSRRYVPARWMANGIPYAKSQSIGERMIRSASYRVLAVVLKIGGAFSAWCELPPL
jgi:hypothetical protein